MQLFLKLWTLLLLCGGLWGENGVLEIIDPAPNTLYEEARSSFVLRIGRDIERVEITDQNGTAYTILPDRKRPIYCRVIPLQLGENRITVTGFSKDKTLKEAVREIYYTSPVFKAYKYPPAAFRPNPFHTQEHEKRCAACHAMESNERKGYAFEEVKDSNCYGCHKELTAAKYAHAPAVNFLCTACHDPEQMQAGGSKYPTPRRIQKECLRCHEKRKTAWESKRFMHDPVATGHCDKCHNPHASENESFLRKPVWELCTSCHADKMTQKHVITVFSGKAHPTRGKPDPSRPGKELSCISCHNPHAADRRSLLVIKGKSILSLCGKCHQK